MKTTAIFLKSVLSTGVLFLAISCDNAGIKPSGNINDPDAPKGTLRMNLTDAPIDDASVSGVFVTVTEIKVDGKTFNGFGKPKTINVLSLQNGASMALGEMQVASGTYSKIELVLDYDKDNNGNSPGCFVQKTDGTKDKLDLSGSSKNTIELTSKSFTIDENGATDVIIDFDLRKSVVAKNNNYSFVTHNEINKAIRAELMAQTGTIKGKINNRSKVDGNVIVYAYKKGSFNTNSETKGQGSSNVQFQNAVTSAKVDANGNFNLAFLEKGEYELHCSKNSTQESTLGLSLSTTLSLESNIDLKSIKVNAGAQTNLDLSIKTSLLGL